MGTPGPEGAGDDGNDRDRARTPVGERWLPGVVRRRYAVKFLLALLVVVLLVSGVGALSYVQIQDIIEGDAERTLRTSASMQSDSITEWIAGLKTQTAALASATVLDAEQTGVVERYLANSTDVTSTDVLGLHLVDRESGQIIATTTPRFEGQTLADRSPAWSDAVESANETRVGTSDAAFERSGHLLMAFASETRDRDRVLVLVGDIGHDIEQIHRTRAIVTTRVLNAEGRGVFEPRQNTPTSLVNEPAFQAALDGKTRILERQSDVLVFSPVDGNEWVVVTEAPKSELYAASQTVGRNVLVLIAVTVVSLALVGLLLVRRTVIPLSRLRERARAMEQGDLDVDLSTGRDDEIGRLFVAFANMRDALKEQILAANAAREQAEASQRELERQNERLDEFASTVSHDLRNPLNVADGQRELLAMELADVDDPTELDRDAIDHRLAAIGDAHGRLEEIIEDVLALAHGDRIVEDPSEVALADAAEAAWVNVETGDATLRVEGDATFLADHGRLLRALENLFRNAVEHAGESVTVTVAPTEDGFAVSDDGPGVPAEAAESVFDHGHSGTEDGTGLGLSIVRTIASAHGWTVTVDTAYADGARFVFAGVREP